MPNQPPPTLASFKFTTIGQPPSLLMRISNSIDPSATADGDVTMQEAAVSPLTAPNATVAPKALRPLTGLQRPSLLEQLAPEAHSMNAVHSAVAKVNASSSAGSAVPSRLTSSTASIAPSSVPSQPLFQTPFSYTNSSQVNHSFQQPSFPQSMSNPVTQDGNDQVAPSNHLSSQTHPTSTHPQTQADPATELYNKLTDLASESVQWGDIDTLARRFREERDEYRRCHDETLRVAAREKEQLETVLRVTEATFDRLIALKEGRERRLDEERERLTNSARAVGLVPSTSAAVPSGGNAETPAAPGQTEHRTSPLPTQAPMSPTHEQSPTDGPTRTADDPAPITSHTATTTKVATNDGADDMIIDGGGNASFDAEEPLSGVHQQLAACEEQSAAEVDNGKSGEHQAVEGPRPQASGDEEAHRTLQEDETRRQHEALRAEVDRRRELDEAKAKRMAQELAAAELARKRQELAEAEAARVKRDAQAQEDRKKQEAEEAAARKARELDAQRELERAAAQKKRDEEAEEARRKEAEARKQELEAQEAREMAAAEERRVTYEARRKAFLAEKVAQEEQATLRRQQELLEKIDREKAASEEASASSAPASNAPTTTTPIAQKPASVASTKKGDIRGKSGGDAAAHAPLGKAQPPTDGASAGVTAASSAVTVSKKASRKVKEQSVPVKLEADSPPPVVPVHSERPLINRHRRTMLKAQEKMTAAEQLEGSQIPATALPATSPVLPPPRKRWHGVRPQDQVILGPNERDRDRSGMPHSYTMVVRPTSSANAAATSPVLPHAPSPPPVDPTANPQPSWTMQEVSRGENATHDFADDSGMVNDPRQEDYMDGGRSPTPEHIRYARDGYYSPVQATLADTRRMDDHWSPQRSYQRRSPPRKRMRDDDLPASYPPPRRARYSGSISSHGSPPQRRALLPEVSRDRARTPPRWQPPARPFRRGASRSPPPRDTYRPRSPDRAPYDNYTGEALRAASPARSLGSLAYPKSPSPPWSYDMYGGRVQRVPTPPPPSPPPMPPAHSQDHGLLDRITEPVRPKRHVATTGRKQTTNDRRPGPSQPAKRGKANARNATTLRNPSGHGHPLAERLAMGGLESRIS